MSTSKKSNKKELASIKVWSTINSSLVEKYPRIEDQQVEEIIEVPVEQDEVLMDEFEMKIRQMVEESSWKELYLKLTEKSINVKSGSKMEVCVQIYNEMINRPNIRRIDIIKEFMSQQDMSKEGASTYFQNIRTKLKKSTGQ